MKNKTGTDIGKELHDGLGQSLTGIALLSKHLENKLVKLGLPEAEDAARITELVKQGICEINRLAHGLSAGDDEGVIEPSQTLTRLDHVKILIVEDRSDLREIIMTVLMAEGAGVEFAEDGQQAMKLVTNGSFDIVLMDLTLPKVSGTEVMQTLRQAGNTIPIIAISAYPEREKRNQCLNQGFDDYLAKPFEMSALINKIQVILGNKKNGPTTKNIKTE